MTTILLVSYDMKLACVVFTRIWFMTLERVKGELACWLSPPSTEVTCLASASLHMLTWARLLINPGILPMANSPAIRILMSRDRLRRDEELGI